MLAVAALALAACSASVSQVGTTSKVNSLPTVQPVQDIAAPISDEVAPADEEASPTAEPIRDDEAAATAGTLPLELDAPTPTPRSATQRVLPAATATPAPRLEPLTLVPILMYHYIRSLPSNTSDRLGYGLSVSPKLLDDELAYLAGAGYSSISMDDLAGHIMRGAPLPPKPVVLTFDDGYADFFTAALPLLKKWHFHATVYLVVDFLGRPGYMSWQQALQLRGEGMEIGAHTMDHVDLAIQPLAQARHQIGDSRRILQERLNAPVDSFAYPSGRFTPATVGVVHEAGFTSAVTTAFGARHSASKLLTLTRVRVPGGIGMRDFVRNLSV